MVSHVEDYPTDTVAGLEVNTLADGFFHVATWILVLAGSITAIKAWREGRFAPSWSFHFGLVLTGWGIFNPVEGIVDHHLLGVHHVRDDIGSPLAWDLGFLVFGALLSWAGGCCTGAAWQRWKVGGQCVRPRPPNLECTDLPRSAPAARLLAGRWVGTLHGISRQRPLYRGVERSIREV